MVLMILMYYLNIIFIGYFLKMNYKAIISYRFCDNYVDVK